LIAEPATTGVFVEPDDGRGPILDEMQAASCSIDVSVYLLTDDAVIDELVGAAARGIRVRVMLEEHPFGGGGGQYEVESTLRDGGVEVKWSGSDIRFSHAKYVVVDRQIALILNQNLTNASFEGNREFGSVTTEPDAVLQAQKIFDADWEGSQIDEIDGPLIVSPTSSRSQFLALIDGATERIDLYAEVIRDPEIIDALGSAERRGVNVRLIVNEALDEDQQDTAAQLFGIGVEIRLASGLYIHAKAMVIDGDRVVVGSQNFTATSLDHNRELAIVLENPLLVSRCADVFERDWIRASPGAPVEEKPTITPDPT
jgi:phosphatidylserine/phosphatidylglycerophosphate/cardiolipin synthase-like enzyme